MSELDEEQHQCSPALLNLINISESDDGHQPSPVRFSRKTVRYVPSEDAVNLMSPTCKDRDDSDDEDRDGGDGEDGDSVDGDDDLLNDIEAQRHKFQNSKIEEVENMFHKFQEEQLKPCAKCLGCTVSHLMQIGKWSLHTPER
jgi:hypothetical protein